MSSHWFWWAHGCFGSEKYSLRKEPGVTTMNYDGFQIESFEAGKGLWHARIRRADQEPVVIDGVLFSTLEVGFAWSSPDAAAAGAKSQIHHPHQPYPAVRANTQ